MACLPPNWYENNDIWRANTALICFQIVEWHQADRVLRQFGMQQPIPQTPVNLDEVHYVDMRGNSGEYWPEKHAKWIKLWRRRSRYIAQGFEILNNDFTPSEEYISWFYAEGRPFMFSLPAGSDVRNRAGDQQSANPHPPRHGRQHGVSRRRNQPSSVNVDNVTAPRMSFSHPAPERDLEIFSSHRHSISHTVRDDDEDRCYRPQPPITRLDTNLLTPISSIDPRGPFGQFATSSGTNAYGFFNAAVAGSSSSGLGFFEPADINTVITDYQQTLEEATEDETPALQPRGRERQSRSVRANEMQNVERRVLPARNRRAPHCCSTPRDRAHRQ